MAGLIREDDIAEVRDRARIEEVVGAYVTLKPAGAGALKGLCPFHDEKSPSFHVRPGRGYHCFGCGEGGDVISFLMKHDGLGFAEAVTLLAERYGVTLRQVDGDEPAARSKGPARQRLTAANRVAASWYSEQLASPDAAVARAFLNDRGFDRDAAQHFGLGFAPRGGEELYKQLRGRGFTDAELVGAGLVAQGQRGHYDRFRGRLLWPIRDTSGEVIGFGARRLFDDDRIEAKYLNTPETSLYKKSQVLYGIDLARREIAKSSQAVVVEGYTDVMACHLAGIKTAIATCGTAFGEDHGRVLRRLMHDHEESQGEVIFTFDGDEAGQKAALRAFSGDQQFVAQTYVAIQPDGLDPCDVRIRHGDQAVQELVSSRIPLYRFVLSNVVARYDLDRADGRVAAVRAAAALVSSSRDSAVVNSSFARELASLTGLEPNDVLEEVRRASRRQPVSSAATPPRYDVKEPRFGLELDVMRLLVQYPALVRPYQGHLTAGHFTHPQLREIWDAVTACGGLNAVNEQWFERLRGSLDGAAASLVSALAVEPIRLPREPDAPYAAQHICGLLEATASRRIATLKPKLQRTDPGDQTTYQHLFSQLVALEQYRRQLRDLALPQD